MIGKKKLWVKIVIIILLVIGALFAGFPILWMILNSFKPNSEIFAWVNIRYVANYHTP